MESFFTTLFGEAISPDRQLSIFTLPGERSQRFASAEDAAKYIASLPKGTDIYHGLGLVRNVTSGRGKATDVVAVGALWADIDLAGDVHKKDLPATFEEAATLFPFPPSFVISSGNGLHAYWVLVEPWIFEGEEERQVAAKLAKAWHGEICRRGKERGWKLENLGDLSRVLRPPGTFNHKGGKKKPVAFAMNDNGERFTIADFQREIQADEKQAPKPSQLYQPYVATAGSLSAIERCYRYLDAMPPAIEGQGGGTQTFLACKAIYEFGLEGSEARAAFEHYNARCVPQWKSEKQIAHKLAEGAKNGTFGILRDAEQWQQDYIDSGVDLSYLMDLSAVREEDADDDEFCSSMVPSSGLIREIYDYYTKSIYRQCPVFAMATAISVCQSLFGRKVESETGIRTNDYHLILAPTTSGKEGVLTAVSNLFTWAGCGQRVLPEKMQSSNGLLAAVRDCPSCIWVCDEFGMMLQSILDKKNRDTNLKSIASVLLSLYGKSNSSYTGSAYAGRKDHAIDQPHLCVLGVSTGHTVFQEISQCQVMDGMLGRISFWTVQNRPKPNRQLSTEQPTDLLARIAAWDKWHAGEGNLNSVYTGVARIPFTPDARRRWQEHEDKIDSKMSAERAIRSALWGRAAARSMKLALTHRMARLSCPEEINHFNMIEIELQDIDWGIAISNWNTRLACSLVTDQVVDTVGSSLQRRVLAVVTQAKAISQRNLCRSLRSFDNGQITAAIDELERSGVVRTELRQTKGRPARFVVFGTEGSSGTSSSNA